MVRGDPTPNWSTKLKRFDAAGGALGGARSVGVVVGEVGSGSGGVGVEGNCVRRVSLTFN